MKNIKGRRLPFISWVAAFRARVLPLPELMRASGCGDRSRSPGPDPVDQTDSRLVTVFHEGLDLDQSCFPETSGTTAAAPMQLLRHRSADAITTLEDRHGNLAFALEPWSDL